MCPDRIETPPAARSPDAERDALSRMTGALWRRYLLTITIMVVALVGAMMLGDRSARLAVRDAELQTAAARVRGASQRIIFLTRVSEHEVQADVADLNERLVTSIRKLAADGGPRVQAVLDTDILGRSYGERLEAFSRDVEGWLRDRRHIRDTSAIMQSERFEALSLATADDAAAQAQHSVLVERGLLLLVLLMMALKALLVFRPGSRAIGTALRTLYDQKLEVEAARARAEAQASDLERALVDEEAIRREQADFTYAISHDLKSPANTIGLLLHEIEREAASLSPDGAEFLAMAIETVRRMQTLVDSVLNYSRAAGHTAPDTSVPLDTAVSEALADLKADIALSGAEVGCTGPFPPVRGDAVLIRLLVQNLVSNAIKFHQPEKPPSVTISCDSPDVEGRVRLSVADNGIGIADADRDRIFGLFQRLHLADEYPGAGIGLALCRRIVTGVGGDIRVRSQPGKGSTFDVLLPAKAS
jgi:signal transduction histidine kinase